MPTVLSRRSFDSVFSPLGQFESSEKIPFAKDEPYIGRSTIERSLNSIEGEFASNVSNLMFGQAKELVNKLLPAVDKGDLKAINEADWSAFIPLQQLMFGLWSDGWELGQEHGFAEIEAASRGQFSSQYWATFADNRRFPIRKHFLKPIVEGRTIWLSDKVSEETKAQIKAQLVAATLGDESGKKIGKRELYNRISQLLGEDEATTKRERRGIRARARLIGRTELTGVYTLGRLQAYRASGRVRKIRYMTFEWSNRNSDRPCPKCSPKNGHILDLEDDWELIVSEYLIPAHGHCRCTWIPVLDDNPDDRDRMDDPDRDPDPKAGKALGLSWLGAAVSNAGIVLAGSIQQEIARLQAEAKAKKEQRKRAVGALVGGGAALSFAAIFYIFLKQSKILDTVQEAVEEDVKNLVVPTSNILSTDLILPTGIEVRSLSAAQQQDDLVRKLVTPKLLRGLAVMPNPGDISIDQLIAMGVPAGEAGKLRGFIQQYLKWQASRPRIVIGGVDLNLASINQLTDTLGLNKNQASALIQATQTKPITNLKELLELRYSNGRRVFDQTDINRLSLYYLRLNLNDQRLTPDQLLERLKIDPKTAYKIVLAHDKGGDFIDWNDMQRRTGLSPQTIRKIRKSGARIDREALPLLTQGQPQAEPMLLPNAEIPKIASIQAQVERQRLDRRVQEARERIEQHLIQAENRMAEGDRTKVDQAISRATERLGTLESYQSDLQAQTEQISSDIEAVESRLERLEDSASGLTSGAIDIESSRINELVDGIGSRLQTLELNSTQRLKDLQKEIGRLDGSRKTMSKNLSNAATEQQATELRREIKSILDEINTLATGGDTQLKRRADQLMNQLSGRDGGDRLNRITELRQRFTDLSQQINNSVNGQQGLRGAGLLLGLLKQRLASLNNNPSGFSQFSRYRSPQLMRLFR